MNPEEFSLGIVLNGCENQTPCKHCLSRDYLSNEPMDFGLLEFISERIRIAIEGGISIRSLTFSAGEPLNYRSGGRNLADVVELVAGHPQFLAVKTKGISQDSSPEEKEILERIVNVSKQTENISFWFSFNPYSEGDQIERISYTVGYLNSLGFDIMNKSNNPTKKLRVTITRDMDPFLDLVERLLLLIGYDEVEPHPEAKHLTFFSNGEGDTIELGLSHTLYMGRAKKYLSFLDYTEIKDCSIQKGVAEPTMFINSDGTIGFCECFSILDQNPFGNIREISLSRAWENRTKFVTALDRMVNSKPDLTQYKGQLCAYCEDNLGKYLAE